MRGPSLDLKLKILDRIVARPGTVWTPVDFLDLGARAAVDKALQRLAAADAIRRIDRGLYDRPTVNSLTKTLTPPPTRAIIDAVARRDQARLLVDGMTAANDLGLTTAVPAKVTVLTDARLKALQLGAQLIEFRQAAPSRLYWAGRPAMRVVQALHWLHDVLPSDGGTIKRRLGQVIADPARGQEIAEDLAQGLSAMPTWMQSVVRELTAGAHGGDHDHHQQPDHRRDQGDHHEPDTTTDRGEHDHEEEDHADHAGDHQHHGRRGDGTDGA